MTRSDRRWAGGAAGVVLVASFAFFHLAQPGFTGDEPHYVVYARSLGEGWGLDVERAYRPESVAPFYGGSLDPHAARYAGADGRVASWHGVGLPVLLAPAIAVHPTAWTARHVMMLITAALAYHLVLLARRVTRCPPLTACLATLALLLAPPVLFYSGLVFPETPAALLTVLALRCASASAERRFAVPAASALAGLLPWFGLRYAIITATLLVVGWIGELRRRGPMTAVEVARASAPVLLPAAALGLALVVFNLELFGAVTPPQDTGDGSVFYRPKNLYLYGVGAVLGYPSGVVPLAPILLVPAAALAVAIRRTGLAAAGVAIGAAGYAGFNAYFGTPGTGPPGRYLATVVPLLAVPLAIVLRHGRRLARGATAVLAALTALSVVTSVPEFNVLFGSQREGIQPISATAEIWPFVFEDTRPGTSHFEPGWLQSATGQLDVREHRVAREGRDEAGSLIFGPYVQLQPGRYVARFSLENRGSREIRPAVDIHSPGVGVLASTTSVLAARAEHVEAIDFETDGESPLEFRVWWPGLGTLAITGVSAELIDPAPARRTRSEWWKAAAWTLGLVAVAGLWMRLDT